MTGITTPPRNRILAGLPRHVLDTLRPDLEHVELITRSVLVDIDVPISHVYFVERGVTSVVGGTRQAQPVEVATIGNEGLVGLPVFLGTDRTSVQSFVQVPGEALRMEAARFRKLSRDGPLHAALQRFTQALFTFISQAAACNRLHAIGERCARWLLLTHDRVGEDEFPLPPEFLAQMLGIGRSGVGTIARRLQSEGLIRYQRASLTILDRPGLERVSCECYAIVTAEFARLLGPEPEPLATMPATALEPSGLRTDA